MLRDNSLLTMALFHCREKGRNGAASSRDVSALLGRIDGPLLDGGLGGAAAVGQRRRGVVQLLGGGRALQALRHEDQVDLLERAAAGLRAAEVDFFGGGSVIRSSDWRRRGQGGLGVGVNYTEWGQRG